LKSPPHSLRIPLLLELFPDARFVHVVRDPYETFPSTLKMNKSLLRLWAVQEVTEARLEQQIFERGTLLYERLEKGTKLISPNRFHELRYEDLVRDPMGQLQQLYAGLELEGFEEVRPALEQHLARIAEYAPTQHKLDSRLRGEITRHWGAIIERYGYSAEKPEATQRQSADS
jgi:hypothetical protein